MLLGKKVRQEIIEKTGFIYDEETMSFCGIKKGYYVLLMPNPQNNGLMLRVSVSNGGLPNKEFMKSAKKECKAIKKVSMRSFTVNFFIKEGLFKSKQVSNILRVLNFLPDFLKRENYQNCSEESGKITEVDFYCVGGNPKIITEEEFQRLSQEKANKETLNAHRGENLIGGLIGAFLGSLLGVIAIIFSSQLGYISILGGMIMGFCSIKGYEILSGKITKKGIFFSVLIIILMTYAGDRLNWAIELVKVSDYSIFEAFQAVPEEIIYADLVSLYWTELLKLAIFTALGAIPTILFVLRLIHTGNLYYKIGNKNLEY